MDRAQSCRPGSGAQAAMLALMRGRPLRLNGGLLDAHRLLPEVGRILAETVLTRPLEGPQLSSGGLGTGGAAGPAAAPFERLSRLELGGNAIEDEEAAVQADAPAPATPRGLELNSHGIGDAGAPALAASPYLTGLEWLGLRHNRFGDRAARALRERFGGAVHS